MEVKNIKLPNHIAVIVDGNRRWAKSRNKPPWYGHRKGAERVEEFIDWCVESGIKNISIYTLSTENLERRPRKEIQELFKIMKEYVNKLLTKKYTFLEKYSIRVSFVGEIDKLPRPLIKLMYELMEKTAKHNQRVLNFLVAYGGKKELVYVIRKIVETAMKIGKIEITEKDIENNLWVPIPVDLIIRTGGYSRLSNLLIWQSAYAEIYTTKTLWPDFNKKEFMKALAWYSSVKRNFGK